MGSHTTSVNFSSYDTSHYSYYNVNSSYPLSNAYTASNSTTYAQIRWKRNANAQTYIYYKFSLSIPSNATITSVTVKSKAYVNTTTASRVTTRTMQLADSRDQTTFGSTLTIGSSATEQTFSNTGITWTPEKLNNLCVKFLIVRGTSNTSSTYNLQIYGGTVSVTYTLPDCTITTTNNTSYSFNVPASYESGNAFTITCSNSSSPSALGLTVTVNDTDITSQFVSAGGVWVCTISGLSVNVTVVIDYAVTYSVTLTNNTTALVTIVPNSNISPGGYSTITISGNTSPVGRYIITDNGTDITSGFISSGANYVNTITNINEDHVVVFNYAIALYFKNGTTWVQVSKAYKKVSGSWVLQNDLTTVFDPTIKYKKYVRPLNATVSQTGTNIDVSSVSGVGNAIVEQDGTILEFLE